MNTFPEERMREMSKKFDAGWDRDAVAPYDYWRIYIEAAYVEGARDLHSLLEDSERREIAPARAWQKIVGFFWRPKRRVEI